MVSHPAEARKITSVEDDGEKASKKGQTKGKWKSSQDPAAPQGQEGTQEEPEAGGSEMETEAQEEPPSSDHESEISSPRSEQSSIKTEDERMVGMEEVTAATGDMILETPQKQEAPSCKGKDPGAPDEPQQ